MIVPGNAITLTNSDTTNGVIPEIESHVAKAISNIRQKHAEAFIQLQQSSRTDKTNKEKDENVGTGGRGIVYIGHIPDGFFEDELHQYLSQFGQITRLKLARSRKTGKSKGYAFIEFKFLEVAKVVAETMNNYLLNNRLLKANIVDKKYPASFWSQPSCHPQNCPLARNRRLDIKNKNCILTPAKELVRQGKRRRHLTKALIRLKEAGVNYAIEVKDQIKVSTTAGTIRTLEVTKHIKQKKLVQRIENITAISQPVLVVDESDSEIEFNEPSFVIRKPLKRQSQSPLAEQEPKVKKGRSKSETIKPKTPSPKLENKSPGKQQDNELNFGSSQETRSGRVSMIPKHISSEFQITLSSVKRFNQSNSPNKENNDALSPEISPSKVKRKIGLEKRKSKGGKTPAGNNINISPKNSEGLSPKSRKSKTNMAQKADNTSNVFNDATVSVKHTPKERRNSINTAENRTPKSIVKESPSNKSKNFVLLDPANKKGKKEKSPKSTSVDKRKSHTVTKSTLSSSPKRFSLTQKRGSVEKNSPKTPKVSPKQAGLLKKAKSVDNILKKQFTPKTPVGRKSLLENKGFSNTPIKQASALKKANSVEKKLKQLKPLKSPKTPSRKSQIKSPGSAMKLTPVFHSTAMKKHSIHM